MMWLRRDSQGLETFVAYSFVNLVPLGFGDRSDFQNTAEYIAAVLGARGLVMLGAGAAPTLHRGDSKSALSWTQRGAPKSDLALRAGLVWALQVMVHGVNIQEILHLANAVNTRMDLLSRGYSWEDVWLEDQTHYGGTLPRKATFLDLQCEDLVHLCDPSLPIDSEEAFADFFHQGMALVQRV